jgi:hypothetical protein
MLSLFFHSACTDAAVQDAGERERPTSRAAATSAEPRPATLAVPTGRSWLRLSAADRDAAVVSTAPPTASAPPALPIALETLARPDAARLGAPGGAALLAAVPVALGARLNGLPALPLALLQPGDRLEVPGGPVLTLFARLRPEFGPPPPEAVGRPCPVCRTPVAADCRVYVCRCGAAIHAEDESRPAEQRLECAQLTTVCAACQQAIHREEVTLGASDS